MNIPEGATHDSGKYYYKQGKNGVWYYCEYDGIEWKETRNGEDWRRDTLELILTVKNMAGDEERIKAQTEVIARQEKDIRRLMHASLVNQRNADLEERVRELEEDKVSLYDENDSLVARNTDLNIELKETKAIHTESCRPLSDAEQRIVGLEDDLNTKTIERRAFRGLVREMIK